MRSNIGKIESIIESKDINYIYAETLSLCSNLLNENMNGEEGLLNEIIENIKIIEESMKIDDIVILKDILRYEMSKYLDEV